MTRTPLRAALAALSLALALALAACTPDDGPLMDPGEDCVACHNSGEGPDWTFAGTVFPAQDSPESAGVQGVRVRVTDSAGRTETVVSNEAGNFYLADGLRYPLVRVELERGGRVVVMEDDLGAPIPVEYDRSAPRSCNGCHTFPPPPDDETEGRLVAP